MKFYSRVLLSAVLIAGLSLSFVYAAGSREAAPTSSPQDAGAPVVIATTPWTAAFAAAAGATNIELLAPYEMRHPPEYELRATDLVRVERADLVVYAGYEGMVERLQAAAGDARIDTVQIATTHTREAMRESVMKIAGALGTEDHAETELAAIEAFFRDWSAELNELGLSENTVVAHSFQAQMLRDLGVEPVGTYGPAPLEAQQIGALSTNSVQVVIDNWHNEVGTPFRETLPDAVYVSWINFPGHDETRTLLDVFERNRSVLNEALLSR